jgi:NADH dehydrogenase
MIFVTGGTGFVGPHVVHALRAAGHDMRALVRDAESKSAKRLADWGVEVYPGDVTNAETLRGGVAGCDTVVHLVGIMVRQPEKYERIMIGGTRELVAAAQAAGVKRFVLMSALGTSEAHKDVAPYYHAKWEQEQMVAASGIPWVAFRPSFVFGPDGGMLQLLLKALRLSPVAPIVGTKRMQPIWVDDVAAFYAAAVAAPEPGNRTYDLVGPDVVSWDELYERMKRVLGKKRATFHMPIGLARAGAAVVERLPTGIPLTRDALTMLELEDNVADPAPATEAFGVNPITLDEQLRRAVIKK